MDSVAEVPKGNEPIVGIKFPDKAEGVNPGERKEAASYNPLPKIRDFPEKAQVKISEAYTDSQEKAGNVRQLIGEGSSIIKRFQEKQQEFEIKKHQELSPQEKEVQDRKLAQIKQEVEFLERAYVRVSRGEDIPELRNGTSPFAKDDTNHAPIVFSDEELKQFGIQGNVASELRRSIANMVHSPDYKASEAFRKKMKELYNTRVNYLFEGVLEKTSILSPLDSRTEDLGKIPLDQLPTQEKVENWIDQYFKGAEKMNIDIMASSYLIGRIDEWVKQNNARLGKTNSASGNSLSGSLTDATDRLRLHIDSETKKLSRAISIQRYPEAQATATVSAVTGRISKSVGELMKGIYANILPIPANPESLWMENNICISQEYVDLAKDVKSEAEAFASVFQVLGINNQDFNDGIKNLGSSVIYRASEQAKANSEFPEAENLLYHVTPFDRFKSILRNGFLGSQKVQLERLGKAIFNSGGMELQKGEVKVTSEQVKIGSGKKPGQEFTQICFSENSPYMYYQGAAFVFSKPHILAHAQFMSADGYHVFDQDYNGDDESSPGYSVDLTKEPMMLVMIEQDLKEGFEKFVKEDMIKQPAWEGIINDPDDWIKQNVTFIPSTRDPDLKNSLRSISWDTVKSINQKFWETKRDKTKVKPGWLMPTGIQGGTPTPNRGKNNLYTYKEAA